MASTRTALRRLVAPIVAWYRKLDPADRWLLAGIKVGWEASIGWNAYYWPRGNSYLERYPRDPSHDPCCHLLNLSAPAWGMVQIGYAAAAAAGLSPSGPGGALSSSDIATLVQWCVESRKHPTSRRPPASCISGHTIDTSPVSPLTLAQVSREPDRRRRKHRLPSREAVHASGRHIGCAHRRRTGHPVCGGPHWQRPAHLEHAWHICVSDTIDFRP